MVTNVTFDPITDFPKYTVTAKGSHRLTVLQGDCVEQMRTLPAESVHCIVTSPPYWGLRDYKIPPSIWAGDETCEHEWSSVAHAKDSYASNEKRRWQHDKGNGTHTRDSIGEAWQASTPQGDFCTKCNAWRGVFGLEPTPELYLEHTLMIFREAWRVLRKDGTLWINLGDSYASDTKWGGTTGGKHANGLHGEPVGRAKRKTGLKGGDLVGIPWRVALALQADGWYLRRDNIWFKPNPMPESVNGWRWEQHRAKIAPQSRGSQPSVGNSKRSRDMSNGEYLGSAEYVDCAGCEKCLPNGGLILRKGNWRCTTSHEYVFQFSKSDSYFCDAEAAREKSDVKCSKSGSSFKRENSKRNVVHIGSNNGTHRPDREDVSYRGNRNRRSVWKIATRPYREAHFATFPPDLVRPIIAAATPVKCCGKCGAPYAPVVERGEPRREQQMACGGNGNGEYHGEATKDFAGNGAEDASAVKARILAGMVEKRVIDHRATCGCGAEAMPATVLDMFGGSGTTGQVAKELGRAAILIELNKEYIPLIQRRCAITPGLGLEA